WALIRDSLPPSFRRSTRASASRPSLFAKAATTGSLRKSRRKWLAP
ncbi:MAG: hypothetical protein AVDCRST_MAG15-1050, partial [uncultured Rubellimicrobium sp.]